MTHHLVGMTEVAHLLGLSRQRVHQLMREPVEFPEPAARLAAGPVWERKAVEEWAERAGRTVQRDDG